ncbi:hypothetical protein LguiB_026467 [Lonicera macranthoides]
MDPIAKKTTKAERRVKQQATPKAGVVIREPTFPSSSTSTLSNTKQEYVVNGKAPITEISSKSSDDEDPLCPAIMFYNIVTATKCTLID